MKEMNMIREICAKKLWELEKLQAVAEQSLKKAPAGTLMLSSSNGSVQYYRKTENGKEYIGKKKKRLLAALAQKDYDRAFCRAAEKERRQLEKIMELLQDSKIEEIFDKLPEPRKALVQPRLLSDERYAEQWQKEEYVGNEYPGEFQIYTTERGEKVRSKSEKILADKLFSMGIPYRYEYPLRLKGYGTVYPDFTLLKVSTREEVYLEHFGMMDDAQYSQKAIAQLQAYARNNIYPGKNLLLTFETSQTAPDMKIVETMLQEFILK